MSNAHGDPASPEHIASRRQSELAARKALSPRGESFARCPAFYPCHCGIMQGVCSCASEHRRPPLTLTPLKKT